MKEQKKERKKLNKNEISTFGFLNFDKVCGTYLSRFSNRIAKIFAFICFVFHGAASMPHVQVAILNLPHP